MSVLDPLLLALLLAALGAHAVAPWRAAGDPAARGRWRLLGLPLLLAGALAALLHARVHPDAALAAGLLPLLGGRGGRALAVLLPALAAVDLLALLGWRRLPPAAWRIQGVFGAALLAAACWAGELLRVGEGPADGLAAVAVAAAARLLVALGAGEIAVPRRPLAALAAAAAVALYTWLLPREVSDPLWSAGGVFTQAAAALLFAAAPFLPPRLRVPALAGATLPAAVVFAQAIAVSQAVSGQPLPPLPPLPVP